MSLLFLSWVEEVDDDDDKNEDLEKENMFEQRLQMTGGIVNVCQVLSVARDGQNEFTKMRGCLFKKFLTFKKCTFPIMCERLHGMSLHIVILCI